MSARARLLVFLFGIVVFGVLVARADLRPLTVDPSGTGLVVALIVGVYGVVYALNAVAWRLVMATGGPPLSFGRAYALTVSGFALNVVTPFVNLGGEPYKIAAAAPWLGGERAAGSVIGFRLLHMLAHLLTFLTGILVATALLPRSALVGAAMLVLTVILVLLAAALFSLQRHGALERLLGGAMRLPLPAGARRWLDAKRPVLVAVDLEIVAIYRECPRRFYAALAVEYTARVVSMFEFLAIARYTGAAVGFPAAFLIGTFHSLVLNLFFFVPFEAGSKEGGLYLVFTLLHLPPSLGITAALVSRMRELAWVAIGLTVVALRGGTRRER